MELRISDYDALHDHHVSVISALAAGARWTVRRRHVVHAREDQHGTAVAGIDETARDAAIRRLRKIDALRVHARQIVTDLVGVNVAPIRSGGKVNAERQGDQKKHAQYELHSRTTARTCRVLAHLDHTMPNSFAKCYGPTHLVLNGLRLYTGC